MKIIFASDSFKDSLTSEQVNTIEIAVAEKVLGRGDYLSLEIADGGEGTLCAIERSVPGYVRRYADVTSPLGNVIRASYLIHDDKAIIEMAEASGLTLVDENMRDPMNTTTLGTGELIRDAVINGARNITIGIGGSATNDGGIGAMTALGYKFIKKDGCVCEGYGRELNDIEYVDDSAIMKELSDCSFVVMCDVRNPLTGANGATYTFGPQKGADSKTIISLERGMINYMGVLEAYCSKSLEKVPGLGAAGGLSAALYVFLKATIKSGVDIMLDLARFDEMLHGTQAVISGEGRTDRQTLNGKAVYGIAKRCKKHNVPLHVISGSLGEGIEELYDVGVTTMTACVTEELSMAEIRQRAEQNLIASAEKVFRYW